MTNIVTANLGKSRFFRCSPLYQYNYGMRLVFAGVELPPAYEVDFANDIGGQSVTQIGSADGVTIPDQFLIPGQAVYCWLYLHPTEDSGVTVATVVIPISPRAVRTSAEPTPVQQDAITEAIAALDAAVTHVDDAVEHYPVITDGVWYVWDVDVGEYVTTGVPAQGPQGNPGQNGTDGTSPTITVTNITGGHRLTIVDANGTHTVDVMDGEDGSPGQNGTDGVSPTVTVTDITGGHRVSITDASGTSTFDVTDGTNGTNGQDGSDGTSAYVWIRYAAAQPTQDSDMKTTPDAWMGIYSGDSATAPTVYTSYTWYNIKGATGPVTDVQVNGTTVVNNGVANVPVASTSDLGAVKIRNGYGINNDTNGLQIATPSDTVIRVGTSTSFFTPVANQHKAVFYGLAKVAGDTTQVDAGNSSLGTYTETAKSKISDMLNAPETVSVSYPSIMAKAGVRYVCGEVSTLDITLPASGIVDVVFQSGSTPTVLTVTPPTGMTVKWTNGFDPTSLEANTVYEINILDGVYGVVGSWS